LKVLVEICELRRGLGILNMNSKIVAEHMIHFPHTADPMGTVKEGMAQMKELGIRHLPIVNKGELIGIVSERDLLPNVKTDPDKPLAQVMTAAPYCVRVATPLRDVIEVMARRKIGCTVVVTARNDVLGIFTTTDAVRLLHKLLKENWDDEVSAMDIEDVFKDWNELDRWPE
jgi:acetoin utilization protein AcuB